MGITTLTTNFPDPELMKAFALWACARTRDAVCASCASVGTGPASIERRRTLTEVAGPNRVIGNLLAM